MYIQFYIMDTVSHVATGRVILVSRARLNHDYSPRWG